MDLALLADDHSPSLQQQLLPLVVPGKYSESGFMLGYYPLNYCFVALQVIWNRSCALIHTPLFSNAVVCICQAGNTTVLIKCTEEDPELSRDALPTLSLQDAVVHDEQLLLVSVRRSRQWRPPALREVRGSRLY